MLLRHLSILLAGGVLAGASAQRVVPRSHVLHERQPESWANHWSRGEKVHAEALLPMRIGLKQRNLQAGHDRLMEISNPLSPNYGKYMTAHEVIDFFAPESSRVESIISWLTESGISADRISHSANKQWVQFDAQASEVEGILYTDFYFYEHTQTGSKGLASEEYHLPAHIAEHVDYITPGIRLRRDPTEVAKLKRRGQESLVEKRAVVPSNTGIMEIPEAMKQSASGESPFNSSVCDVYVSQVCIRNQYRIPKGKLAAPGNELGVFESLNQHYWTQDMDNYWQILYPEIPVGTYPVEKLIDGAIGAALISSENGVEAALDFQAAMPLVWPQQTILFQTDDQYYEISQTQGNTPWIGFWNTFYDAIDGSYCTYSAYGETGDCTDAACKDPVYPDKYGYTGERQCGVYEPTNVISISYGGGESDMPAYYLERQCSEIMKLGLQGTTVVISSGDYGVGGFPGDGGYASGCPGDIFYPQDDATCPYVLAVGSTQFDPYTTAGAPACKLNEVATSRFPSGGGFSNYFARAEWQNDAVQTYLDTADLPFTGYTNWTGNFSDITSGVFNINGRGYPDVSAIGDRFVTAYDDNLYLVGGTSLAAPVWAAIITRLNEERIAIGKGPVGFINPTLYANPQVLVDITEGSNPNCNSDGFPATAGWDPVTGLGSPNYPALLKLFLELP
ncbi:alkaline serine protease [Thozetella sp. PMI_491]|nr:alkaline serine protease [Thozetella sp. PMI_491]